MIRKFFETTADEFSGLDLTRGVNNPAAPESGECFDAGDGQAIINLAAFDRTLNPFRISNSNPKVKEKNAWAVVARLLSPI